MIWLIITIRFYWKSINSNIELLHSIATWLLNCICSQMNCRIIYFISKYHFTSSNLWPQTDHWILLLSDLMSFVENCLMCLVFPWRPRRTAHKTIMKALKGHQNSARPQRLSYCGTWRSYTTWRSPWECFLPPSSRGFWDRQRLGLLAKGWHTEWQNSCVCLSGLVFIRLTFAGSGSSRLQRSQG